MADKLLELQVANLESRVDALEASRPLTLTQEQVTTVLLALRDAMDWHTDKLIACADCDAAEKAGEPTAACERHRPHFRQGSRYNELSELLGGGLETTP